MFICENCGKQVAEGVKATKVVILAESHVFPFRRHANTLYREGKVVHTNDNGGVGLQIVKELTVGPCCADKVERAPVKKPAMPYRQLPPRRY